MKHHEIEANGITLHFAEVGEGPAVLFCHGFPAVWSSWKSQMESVAGAGFKAIALDMRGYGKSSAPVEAEAYTPYETVGDLVAVLDAAEVATATVVGHDFGAHVAWNAAMMRPDRFTAVCCLSVPFRHPGGPSFLDKLRAAGKDQFYWFHMMRAESDEAWANAAITVPGMIYWTSGEAPEESRWNPFDPSRSLLRSAPTGSRTIDANASYIADAVATFARTGFHGALNYYRSIDHFTQHSGAFAGAKIRQPSMFLAGTLDGLNLVALPNAESMRSDLIDLRSFTMLEGVGHWPQLEAPDPTNAALLEFLQDLNTEKAMTASLTSSPFASLKINHSAIRVPDFDTAVAWYAEKLDFRLKQSVSVAGLTFGLLYHAADDSFHFELLAGPGVDNRRSYKDLLDSFKMSGWHHMGLRVDNVDHTINELKRRGATIVSEPHDVAAMGLRVAFFADPWGNLFEVIQQISN
jgi:pimeloyl-ACP methyl ester carboxylesterase/catechol 2,3-dioxygenase-like lactoylglutathione lyase family enzyme